MSIDRIQQIALGQCGISYQDYQRMPLRALFNAIRGHTLAEFEKIKHGYHQARFVGACLSSSAGDYKFWFERESTTKANGPIPQERLAKLIEKDKERWLERQS